MKRGSMIWSAADQRRHPEVHPRHPPGRGPPRQGRSPVGGRHPRLQVKGLTDDCNDEATQYLLVITAGVRVTDLHSGEVLWEERVMAGETSYYTRAAGQSSDRLRGNAEIFCPTVRSFASDEENRAAAEALEQLASTFFTAPWSPGPSPDGRSVGFVALAVSATEDLFRVVRRVRSSTGKGYRPLTVAPGRYFLGGRSWRWHPA